MAQMALIAPTKRTAVTGPVSGNEGAGGPMAWGLPPDPDPDPVAAGVGSVDASGAGDSTGVGCSDGASEDGTGSDVAESVGDDDARGAAEPLTSSLLRRTAVVTPTLSKPTTNKARVAISRRGSTGQTSGEEGQYLHSTT